MDFEVALNAILGFFQEVWSYEEVRTLVIPFLIGFLFGTILWRSMKKHVKKHVKVSSHESAEEAVKELMGRSLQCIKDDIDDRLSIFQEDAKRDVKGTLLEFKKKELDSLSQSLINYINGCQAAAKLDSKPKPIEPEEEVKLTDLNKHLLLSKVKKENLSPRTQFYVKQDFLGRDVRCGDHSFLTKWNNLFKDFNREISANILYDNQLERDLFIIVFVCPKCGNVWAGNDISRLNLPKVYDEDDELEEADESKAQGNHTEQAAEQPKDPILLPTSTLAVIPLREVPTEDQPEQEHIEEEAKEETRIIPDIPEPAPNAEDDEQEAESPANRIQLPPVLPLPITSILPSDEELDKEMQKATDDLKAGINGMLKNHDAPSAGNLASEVLPNEESVQEKAPEEPETPSTPTILPSAITNLTFTEDDNLSKDIEEALKEEDTLVPTPNDETTPEATPEPELKKEELEDTQVLPATPELTNPKLSIYDRRPVLTYPGSEKKERRGFLFRISMKRQNDSSPDENTEPKKPQERAESDQEKELRKRREALMKWERKREQNRKKLEEAIRKRREKEAKQQEKELRKMLRKNSSAKESRSRRA